MQNTENEISTCLFPVCLAGKNAGGKAQISAPGCRNPPGPAKSGTQPNGAARGGMGMQAGNGFARMVWSRKTSAGHRGDPAFAENLLGSLAMLKKGKKKKKEKTATEQRERED